MDLNFSPSLGAGSNETLLATKPCPVCGGVYFQGSSRCDSCGLVFEKFENFKRGPLVAGSRALESLWLGVLEDYENFQAHLNFSRECLYGNKIAFAAQKYRWILEANPSDSIALKMKVRLQELVFLNYSEVSHLEVPHSRWDLTSFLLFLGFFFLTLGLSSLTVEWFFIGALTISLTFGLRGFLSLRR